MFQFHSKAMKFIEEHVWEQNPKIVHGKKRSADENRPFFMYLSFRAPHKFGIKIVIKIRKVFLPGSEKKIKKLKEIESLS